MPLQQQQQGSGAEELEARSGCTAAADGAAAADASGPRQGDKAMEALQRQVLDFDDAPAPAAAAFPSLHIEQRVVEAAGSSSPEEEAGAQGASKELAACTSEVLQCVLDLHRAGGTWRGAAGQGPAAPAPSVP